jgi:hypothetical protein
MICQVLPLRKADEHLVVVGGGPQVVRERLIDAAPAGVRVDRRPDRFATLEELRQAMPVVALALKGSARGVVQADLVLAGASMPHRHGAIAASLQIFP